MTMFKISNEQHNRLIKDGLYKQDRWKTPGTTNPKLDPNPNPKSVKEDVLQDRRDDKDVC